MGRLRRTAKKCRECPFYDKCENKLMEMEGYLKPAAQPLTEPMANPVMRETIDIMVDGHLQKVYKDEIEKQLQMSLFPDRFIKWGI